MKTAIKRFLIIYIALVTFLAAFFAPMLLHTASAAELTFDDVNVLDDLKGAVIGGKEFDLADYPFNERQDAQLLHFVEFGYSVYSSRQDDYGLYAYVYNPQGYELDTSSAMNKIQIKIGELGYDKLYLKYLNMSEAAGYEGLFYKFKVQLSNFEKEAVLKSLNKEERVYEVSGVELAFKGAYKEYASPDGKVQTFTYKGYAKGYGPEAAKESSLTCTVDGLEQYIELDVHQTVYRKKGDFYFGEQAQINSCYFRVPEFYFENNGDLSGILCEWYEYVTKPILVTEAANVYQWLDKLHGGDIPAAKDGFGYAAAMVLDRVNDGVTDAFDFVWSQVFTNVAELTGGYRNGVAGFYFHYDDYVFSPDNPFAAVFFAGNGVSYKDATVSSEVLTAQLKRNSETVGGPYVGGDYSEALFTDFVDTDHTRGYNKEKVVPEDQKILFSNYTTRTLWQMFWGTNPVETEYDSLDAIVEIGEDDLTGSDDEISLRLCVNAGDVSDLKAEYTKAKANKERLILLRYGQSIYYSRPGYVYGMNTRGIEELKIDDELFDNLQDHFRPSKWNSYFVQETVYLKFDIISLWFMKNGVETEVPVVMTPQDVIPGLTPPLEINNHMDGLSWWAWILIVLAVIVSPVLLFIFFPPAFAFVVKILKYLLKALLWLLLLPFRAIKALFNALRKRREEKQREKASEEAKQAAKAEAKQSSAPKKKTSSTSKKKISAKGKKKPPSGRKRK